MSIREDTKSSSSIHSILNLLHKEKIRIMKNGWQGLIGLGLAIFYFYFIPRLLYPIYCLFSSQSITLLIPIGISVISSIARLVLNLIMNHIYASKYRYFEQYRITNKQWP